jgi:hypothetical protein
MGVEAAHARHLVPQALLGQDLLDAVLRHPVLMAVPQAMRGDIAPDRQPAGDRHIVRQHQNSPPPGWRIPVSRDPLALTGFDGLSGWPRSYRQARPSGGIDDDQAGRPAGGGFDPPVARGTKDPSRVVATPVVTTVGADEEELAAAPMFAGTCTELIRVHLHLPGEQVIEERRQVNRQAGFPVPASVRVILGRQPVEHAVDLPQLPLNVQRPGRANSRSSPMASPQRRPV